MRCPSLREAQVKFCRASAYSKMIMRTAEGGRAERCSTDAWVHCPAAKVHREEHPQHARCPFLHEALVQYCADAPFSKFVPYSDAQLARCNDDRHRHCDLLLSLASGSSHPDGNDPAAIPDRLQFSTNHLWLELTEDGHWLAGVDAFIARLAGPVDQLTYLTTKGVQRPAAVLTVNGVDLHLVFPHAMQITDTNNRLRSQTGRLASEPYTGGWLFEGTWSPRNEPVPVEGLRTGDAARAWMRDELKRLDAFVHDRFTDATGLANDGGAAAPGVLHHLSRQDVLAVYAAFLSPYVPQKGTV